MLEGSWRYDDGGGVLIAGEGPIAGKEGAVLRLISATARLVVLVDQLTVATAMRTATRPV